MRWLQVFSTCVAVDSQPGFAPAPTANTTVNSTHLSPLISSVQCSQSLLNGSNMRQWIERLPHHGTGVTGALRELYREYHQQRAVSLAIDDVLRSCMSTSQLDMAKRERATDASELEVRVHIPSFGN